ncbi:hypothetical protein [Mycobacteroides abscessus]|uniref:Uncharacterized protein n=1 Tax=Mycobacteroides abscessus TaxID=36809 RepID=A0ABD7HL55_9MYCO|nr:hypothetical protein [Mycobacteroides abscessus]MDM2421921.1 hypothetical protein [Mycobacteroides abscessus]MDM2427356.1 hypothetical protein [Mycobacteroides abscessus]MDM2429431.1 hypothetical protein [Mycobacteroides abscessus]MDM2437722.1 hypothetical protein [Mycobacteroides abscessus]MDM2442465.1 hypothetical protein [Mycobacteroides abscessus]
MSNQSADRQAVVDNLRKVAVPADLPAARAFIDFVISQEGEPLNDISQQIHQLGQVVGHLSATVIEIVDTLGRQAK